MIRRAQAPRVSCSHSFCWSRRGYLIGQKQPSDDTDEIFDEQALQIPRMCGCQLARSCSPQGVSCASMLAPRSRVSVRPQRRERADLVLLLCPAASTAWQCETLRRTASMESSTLEPSWHCSCFSSQIGPCSFTRTSPVCC